MYTCTHACPRITVHVYVRMHVCMYVCMHACLHVPPISVGNLCRAKCSLLLDPLSNFRAPLKFSGLDLPSQISGSSQICLDLSSQIFGSSQICLDLSSQISGLWNLKGSSQNLRRVLWNPFSFERNLTMGILSSLRGFHRTPQRTPLKFERLLSDSGRPRAAKFERMS